MKKTILAVGDSHLPSAFFENALLDRLKDIEEVETNIVTMNLEREEVFGYAESLADQEERLLGSVGDIDVLVVHLAPVTSKVMDGAKRLALICCPRSAPLNVDFIAAKERGIHLSHDPYRSVNAVAELTIGLMLDLARKITESASAFKRGRALTEYEALGIELEGKTLGIIGCGRIGATVAAKAKVLGMEVLAYDPYVPAEKVEGAGAHVTELKTLLARSDFLSIHARLRSEKGFIIGRNEISLMKKGAFLVNTSRGLLLDEKATYEALRDGRIGGAALDVLIRDRDPNNPLTMLNNVILTPHIGSTTVEQMLRASNTAAEEVKRYLTGQKLRFPADPRTFMAERQLLMQGRMIE